MAKRRKPVHLELPPPDPFFDGATIAEQEADNYDPNAPLRFADIVDKADRDAKAADKRRT